MSSKTNPLTRGKKQKVQDLLQLHRLEEARLLLEQICNTDRRDAESWYLLAAVNQHLGRLDDAITAYRQVLVLQPQHADALYYLGNALRDQNKPDEAAQYYRQAISEKPDYIEAHCNLGSIFEQAKDYAQAAECHRAALHLDPMRAELHYNLGTVLDALGHLHDAEKCLRQAITLKPDFALAYNNLGNVLTRIGGRSAEELECYIRAVELKPDYYEAHLNLASMFNEQGLLAQAVDSCEQALRIKPSSIEAHIKLAVNHADQGRIDDAISRYQQALGIDPNHTQARSRYAFILNYSPKHDTETIYAQHRCWAEPYTRLALPTAYDNVRDPNKRLRIGYVSPDFRTHSVVYFIEPVLKYHNQTYHEISCYAEVGQPDTVTSRLQTYASRWRNIKGLTNEQVYDLIRSDGIDILVDLAGHTANNRLLVFARKPAPVQLTYLGYPNTTGLPAIDYRVTDIWADPPGQEKFHTEALLRLPHGFLCYHPRTDAPPVNPLPALRTGRVTFCSFNAMRKITPEVIGLWSRILLALPNSRLVLKNKSMRDTETRQRCLDIFGKHNIDPSRIDLLEIRQSAVDHLAVYNEIDIALDTFPYNGTTTTCEAIWMGVPVITLEGNRHAGRVGVSLFNQIGLGGLIGKSQDEYSQITIDLANDLDRLATIRSELRKRMADSVLCNGPSFIRDLESAYRDIWERWCTTTS